MYSFLSRLVSLCFKYNDQFERIRDVMIMRYTNLLFTYLLTLLTLHTSTATHYRRR